MKNNSLRSTIILAVVIVSMFSLIGIVWAAFTTTLTINGDATVAKQGWDIHFSNLSDVSLEGKAIETSTPTIDSESTSIGDYKFSFIAPGDSGSYTFDIVNAGTFGAKLSTLTNTDFTCTDSDDSTTSSAATNVCNHLSYNLVYTDTNSALGTNDTLKAGDSVNVTLTVTYDSNTPVADLPNKAVEVTGITSTLIYTQDNNVTTTTGKN